MLDGVIHATREVAASNWRHSAHDSIRPTASVCVEAGLGGGSRRCEGRERGRVSRLTGCDLRRQHVLPGHTVSIHGVHIVKLFITVLQVLHKF